MLQFQPITLKDGARLRPYFSQSPSKQLVDCFEAFYLWRDVLWVEYAEQDGFVIFKVSYDSGIPQFIFPFGAGDPLPQLRKLTEYCKSKGHPLHLAKVRKEQLLFLQEHFPGKITAAAHRDHAEYIYETERFRTYAGKDLQSKRNFVNFARNHFQGQFEAVSQTNLQECCTFVSTFNGDGSFEDDTKALLHALDDFRELKMEGGLIRTGDTIAALFVCTMLGDGETAAGLFLRGDHEKKGIIPLLYQEYFQAHPEYRYFNFGEDLGVEGLRKNKLSFYPDTLLELYEVNFL